jgi:hypothetical protein
MNIQYESKETKETHLEGRTVAVAVAVARKWPPQANLK